MEPFLLPPAEYRLTPWRWHVLALFALSNCNQCLWLSFNSTDMGRCAAGERMDKPSRSFPELGADHRGAVLPGSDLVLSRPDGLQRGVWVGMLFLLFGNVIRCVPLLGGFHQTFAAFVIPRRADRHCFCSSLFHGSDHTIERCLV